MVTKSWSLRMKIVVDTREQRPLWVKDTIRKGLKVGDYSIEGYETEIVIERKSPTDLFGTLGKGHTRFKKELEKALMYKYFAIVIEVPYGVIKSKCFNGSEHSNMLGSTVLKILFTLNIKYGINIFFARTRAETKSIIKEIFEAYIRNINR